jgi:uncharacterized OsmC-like protein
MGDSAIGYRLSAISYRQDRKPQTANGNQSRIMSDTTSGSTIRTTTVRAESAPAFGRVLCNAREHHIVVDGPVQNGCPGEALTPPELLFFAVASCGVELMHVIARDGGIPLERVTIGIDAMIDRARQARTDRTHYNRVTLDIVLTGVTGDQARELVEGFQRRCPIYGTVATATPEMVVNFRVA